MSGMNKLIALYDRIDHDIYRLRQRRDQCSRLIRRLYDRPTMDQLQAPYDDLHRKIAAAEEQQASQLYDNKLRHPGREKVWRKHLIAQECWKRMGDLQRGWRQERRLPA